MARKQTFIVKCDCCEKLSEVEENSEAPDGWLRVQVEAARKYDPRAAFEFCSEKCLAKWAKARSTFNASNGRVSTNSLDIGEAIKLLGENAATFTGRDIQDLTGLAQSTVDTWLRKNDHLYRIASEGAGPNPRTYSLPITDPRD